MVDLNVRENAAMTALDRLTVGPIVSRRREVVAVERELSELAVKAPSLEAPVSSLSGGNQQKIVMARAMLSEPAILVADEPTQGVDVGARAEIYRILREVAARGVPVVVASSDTQGARRAVRPRDRDVPRPGGRDARGRRRDRGADRSRRDQRDHAHRGAGGAARRAARRGSRGSSKATTRRSSSSRLVIARPRSLRPVAEQPLPLGLQHQLRHVRVRGARLHLSGTDIRPAARRDRSLRRSTRRLPRRPRRRSSCSTAAPRGVGARVRPDARVRGWQSAC